MSLARMTCRRPCLAFGKWLPAATIDARAYATFNAGNALPRVAQPSLWTSLVPKFIRERRSAPGEPRPRSKEWNPATFFIVMFMLIGSNAIQMIALKHSQANYMRQFEGRAAKLRKVIEAIKAGEDVDLEKALGTGDPEEEAAWEKMMDEIEGSLARGNPAPKHPEKGPAGQASSEISSGALPGQADSDSVDKMTATKKSPESDRAFFY